MILIFSPGDISKSQPMNQFFFFFFWVFQLVGLILFWGARCSKIFRRTFTAALESGILFAKMKIVIDQKNGISKKLAQILFVSCTVVHRVSWGASWSAFKTIDYDFSGFSRVLTQSKRWLWLGFWSGNDTPLFVKCSVSLVMKRLSFLKSQRKAPHENSGAQLHWRDDIRVGHWHWTKQTPLTACRAEGPQCSLWPHRPWWWELQRSLTPAHPTTFFSSIFTLPKPPPISNGRREQETSGNNSWTTWEQCCLNQNSDSGCGPPWRFAEPCSWSHKFEPSELAWAAPILVHRPVKTRHPKDCCRVSHWHPVPWQNLGATAWSFRAEFLGNLPPN